MGEGSWEVAADREPSRKRILPPEYALGDINSPNVKKVTKATALSMCESPVKDEFRICQRAVVYSGAVAGVSCFKLVNPVAIAFCEAVIGITAYEASVYCEDDRDDKLDRCKSIGN